MGTTDLWTTQFYCQVHHSNGIVGLVYTFRNPEIGLLGSITVILLFDVDLLCITNFYVFNLVVKMERAPYHQINYQRDIILILQNTTMVHLA